MLEFIGDFIELIIKIIQIIVIGIIICVSTFIVVDVSIYIIQFICNLLF